MPEQQQQSAPAPPTNEKSPLDQNNNKSKSKSQNAAAAMSADMALRMSRLKLKDDDDDDQSSNSSWREVPPKKVLPPPELANVDDDICMISFERFQAGDLAPNAAVQVPLANNPLDFNVVSHHTHWLIWLYKTWFDLILILKVNLADKNKIEYKTLFEEMQLFYAKNVSTKIF